MRPFIFALLAFFAGLLVGFGLASLNNQSNPIGNKEVKNQQQHKKISSSTSITCPTISDAEIRKRQRKEKEELEEEEERAERKDLLQKASSSSSSSSSSSDCYMGDLKTSFLASFADSSSSSASDEQHQSIFAKIYDSSPSSSSPPTKRKSFKELGDNLKDDKTLVHRFDRLYSSYLEPVRQYLLSLDEGGGESGISSSSSPSSMINIFEVGLGCNQHLGTGASARLFGSYFSSSSRARMAMLEFDKKCALEWPKQNAHLVPGGGFAVYPGDQTSRKDWDRVLSLEDDVAAASGKFRKNKIERGTAQTLTKTMMMMYDLIIDDGAHSMESHLVTFEKLWPRLKSKGVYVVEDMNTCWKSRYGGTKRGKGSCSTKTTNNLVKVLMDRLHALPVPGHKSKQDEDVDWKSPIFRVDCMHFICFITKK